MTLRLANNLKLPIHIVTESIGILAKRRAGKSTTARRLTEQLHKEKQQVVVADPKGDWWGLLFARDGKSPGLPFVVLGGEHGHIPLEVGAGELVAKMVVSERVKRSTRDAYIGRLQAKQLLAKGGGPITASAVLFE